MHRKGDPAGSPFLVVCNFSLSSKMSILDNQSVVIRLPRLLHSF